MMLYVPGQPIFPGEDKMWGGSMVTSAESILGFQVLCNVISHGPTRMKKP